MAMDRREGPPALANRLPIVFHAELKPVKVRASRQPIRHDGASMAGILQHVPYEVSSAVPRCCVTDCDRCPWLDGLSSPSSSRTCCGRRVAGELRAARIGSAQRSEEHVRERQLALGSASSHPVPTMRCLALVDARCTGPRTGAQFGMLKARATSPVSSPCPTGESRPPPRARGSGERPGSSGPPQ